MHPSLVPIPLHVGVGRGGSILDERLQEMIVDALFFESRLLPSVVPRELRRSKWDSAQG